MPRKKKRVEEELTEEQLNAHIIGAGDVVEQNITDTLETNYMPYAMSVIMSRAIPEIDGFKPSHRKLLYTMYKMGLLNEPKVKSANIVGRTMQLNPHGDAAIYETMEEPFQKDQYEESYQQKQKQHQFQLPKLPQFSHFQE